MDKNIFSQLEGLVENRQIAHLKKIYPDFSGIKVGDGFLWQHPGNNRQKILIRFGERLAKLGLFATGLDSRV